MIGPRHGREDVASTIRCVILDRLDIDAKEFERATGWEIKPEGACKADVCVPLPDGDFDLAAVAAALRRPVVVDVGAGMAALGLSDEQRRRVPAGLEAAPFSLPDLDGKTFPITSLRGQKVLVVAWAPY